MKPFVIKNDLSTSSLHFDFVSGHHYTAVGKSITTLRMSRRRAHLQVRDIKAEFTNCFPLLSARRAERSGKTKYQVGG
jgi:hypothetical protein